LSLENAIFNLKEKFSKEQALVLTYNLLSAVKFLHEANILHRDIKPDNILVTEDFQVKLCDFGFSRSINKESAKQKTRSLSPTVFTRYYRPPEVILNEKRYNQSADVWSIGCVLSEVFQKIVKD